MKLIQPFVADAQTMRNVCINEKTGERRYSDELLAKLPKWLGTPELYEKNNIMVRTFDMVGFSRTRAVWRMGFIKGSEAANAYGIDTGDELFLFVLSDYNGNIVDMFNGAAFNLPENFRKVIDSKPFKGYDI